MPIVLDVNPAFEAWKSSAASEKEQTLRVLIQRLERFATSICWKRLPDYKGEFKPLVNTIVWRAINKAAEFKQQSQFSTWFYAIILNECNRFLRTHKERQEVGLEEDMMSPVNVDARMDLIEVLGSLEGNDHLLFRMVAEGESFKTIGAMLGLTPMTAATRWFRLKEKLRDAF